MKLAARPVKALAGIVAGVALLALGGCAQPVTVASQVAELLPDLAELGYTEFDCGTGVAIDDTFVTPEAPYVAHCWKGTPSAAFIIEATTLLNKVLIATGGVDVSAEACPEDVLNETAGIACRAAYVGTSEDEVLVRIIVTVANLEEVLAKVPAENATSDDVIAALEGAEVEVLIGTEPVETAAVSPAP